MIAQLKKFGLMFVMVAIGFGLGRLTLDTAAPVPSPPAPVAEAPKTEPATPAASAPDALQVRRTLVDAAGKTAAVCVLFSNRLKAGADFAPFVKLGAGETPKPTVLGNQLCLDGLAPADSYRIELAAGLPAANGASLAAAQTLTATPAPKPASGGGPAVAFPGSGFILPRLDGEGVPVETRNLDRLGVVVYRLSDRALIPSSYFGATAQKTMSQYGVADFARNEGTEVWRGTLSLGNKGGEAVTTAIPLSTILTDRRPGAYLIVAAPQGPIDNFLAAVTDTENYRYDYDSAWYRLPVQWVVDTDVGLTAYTGGDGLTIAARSYHSARPAAGVDVLLLSQGNDILDRQTTDANGIVRFARGLLRGRGGATASGVQAFGTDGQLAVLNLRSPAFDLSDRGVSGRPEPGPNDAFIYADRGIYRPGETAHFVGLMRDARLDAGTAPSVQIALRRPNGAEYDRRNVALTATGAYPLDFTFPKDASRGLWTAEFYLDPTAKPLARLAVDVQDFVPQKLKVEASSPQTEIAPGETLTVTIDGQFLHGGAASEIASEASATVIADPLPVANAPGYRFGLFDAEVPNLRVSVKGGLTDDQGRAAVALPINLDGDDAKKLTKPLKIKVSAGLFEPGGRANLVDFALPLRTQPVLVGVRPQFPGDRVPWDAKASFDLRAFDPGGQPVPRKLNVRLIEEDWSYDWYRDNGQWRWNATVRDRVLKTETVDVTADKPLTYIAPITWGRYRLEVADSGSGAATSLRFRTGWGAVADATDTPDSLNVTSDKATYAVGETARVRILPQAAGEATLVVATGRVLEIRNVAVPKDGAIVELKATQDWGAGAYVLVSHFRPLSERSPSPVRSVGVVWLGIDNAPRTLGVDIALPDKILPRQKLAVPVSVKGLNAGEKGFVTVAAVDEGILQLTRFASPAPQKWFFGKRGLGVEMRDAYAKLIESDAAAGAVRSGGDGIGGVGLDVVPTKTLALFSGLVALDDKGTAVIDFDIPDFNGQIRLMAVAVSAAKLGSGDGKLTVRDPVVAELTLPRFLAPGDKSRMTLLLHNLDGLAGDYTVTFKAGGEVNLPGGPTLTVPLAQGAKKIETIELAAGDPGIGQVGIAVSGPGGFSVARDWPIQVRSPYRPITLTDVATQADGDTFTVPPTLADAFLPGSYAVNVNYSTLKGFDVAGLLQSLDRYPYGCSEQITSRALPLLSFGDPNLLALAGTKTADGAEVVKSRIQTAIETLIDRQGPEGQFGLWRAGDSWDTPFLQAYVVDFLTAARTAGFTVPNAALNLAFADLVKRTAGGDRSGAAYAWYVLAREGRASAADIARLAVAGGNNQRGLTMLAAAQTATAAAAVGDIALADAFFKRAGEIMARPNGVTAHDYYDYYTTFYRDRAASIALAAEARRDAFIDPWLTALAQVDKPATAMNTQEKAWALRAASQLVKGREVRLAIDGVELAAARQGTQAVAPTAAQIGQGFRITNRSGIALNRTMTVHGAPLQAPPPLSQQVTLKKQVLDRNGKPADLTKVAQQDEFIIILSGRLSGDFPRRMVLVDMLPAGLEISAVARWNDAALQGVALPFVSKLNVAEARDDRYVAAFDLRPPSDCYSCEKPKQDWHEFSAAYAVRAVTPGSYVLPGAQIEDMYAPTVMAVTASGSLSVAAAK